MAQSSRIAKTSAHSVAVEATIPPPISPFLVATATFIVIVLCCVSVFAQTEENKPPDTSAKLVTHDGKRGMWFPMPSARRLLKDVKLQAATESALKMTERRLILEKERSDLLVKNQVAAERIASLWKKTAAQQAKVLEKDEAWWRIPHLWVVVGFTAGVAATIGLTFAVNHSGATK